MTGDCCCPRTCRRVIVGVACSLFVIISDKVLIITCNTTGSTCVCLQLMSIKRLASLRIQCSLIQLFKHFCFPHQSSNRASASDFYCFRIVTGWQQQHQQHQRTCIIHIKCYNCVNYLNVVLKFLCLNYRIFTSAANTMESSLDTYALAWGDQNPIRFS